MAAVAAGTVGEALSAAVDAIRAAGAASPELDAELLLAAASGVGRARLVADPDAAVDAVAAREFGGFVRRRVRREPVAYILGRRGFRRLDLAVDGRVLIPRPETELLVEVALELRAESVADVGTGSGAIALAVADELPDAELVAGEPSLDALVVARANAERLGLAERVRFAHGPGLPDGRFGLVLANLPYVAEAEWAGLEPEITHFEPRDALVAGPTGLEAIDSLLGEPAIASRAAAIALEVGAGQAPTVAELVRRAGWERVSARSDLAGIERVVVGTS